MQSPFCATTCTSSTLSRELKRGDETRTTWTAGTRAGHPHHPWIPPWPGGVPLRGAAAVAVLHPRGLDSNDGKSVARIRRHIHQLFRQLRFANNRSHRDVLKQDFGHFDNLLGIRHERIEETEDVHQLSPISGTGTSRDGKNDTLLPICSTVCRWTRSCGPTPGGQAATRRQAHLRRQAKSTQCLPPGEWDAPERGRAVLLVPTPPALAIVCLRGAEWRVNAARAMRTVCCSCVYHERSRRSLRR